MRTITKRSAAIASAAVLAVGAAGGAWAAGWLVNGTGSATATTASITDMTATVEVVGNLYPGKQIDAVAKVTNPNEFPVTITDISNLVLTVTKNNSVNALCTIANAKIVPSFPASATINAGAVNQEITIPVAMGTDASADCAGSAFLLGFKFKGESGV
jgi:hypothetical protein